MDDREAIRDLLRRIDDAWRNGRYDDIGALVHDDVTVIPPGFERRVVGRSAYVESYREFGSNTVVGSFTLSEPAIDIAGETAVAVSRYAMTWTRGDQSFEESGHELVVLGRTGGTWRIAWRTLVSS